MTVLLFTWDTHIRDGSSSRYFVFINFLVHSVMYTYYAVMAMGIKSVSSISIMITSMQIIQMAIGKQTDSLTHSHTCCTPCVHAFSDSHMLFILLFLVSLSHKTYTTGMFVLLRVNTLISSGNKCSDSAFTVLTGLLMYASYFLLFANFFIRRYVFSSSKKQESQIRKKL